MNILVSACLLGIDCKYNGKNNLNEQVVKESALMIVKAYNKRGVQLASKTIPVTSAYSGEVFLECKDATGYKLMFWGGFDKINPYYAVIDGSL